MILIRLIPCGPHPEFPHLLCFKLSFDEQGIVRQFPAPFAIAELNLTHQIHASYYQMIGQSDQRDLEIIDPTDIEVKEIGLNCILLWEGLASENMKCASKRKPKEPNRHQGNSASSAKPKPGPDPLPGPNPNALR